MVKMMIQSMLPKGQVTVLGKNSKGNGEKSNSISLKKKSTKINNKTEERLTPTHWILPNRSITEMQVVTPDTANKIFYTTKQAK